MAGAQLTGSVDRYDLNSTAEGENVREHLMDAIYQVAREETPFISNIGKETAKSNYVEWLLDDLATPVATNAQIDGFTFTPDTMDAPHRVGNYCQISAKQIRVTRRADTVTKAGRKSELARLITKKGVELRRDIEATLLKGQVASAGTATAAPTCAGVPSWLLTNDDRGGGSGAAPALSGTTKGYPSTAPVDGTDRALSEATLLSIIKGCHAAGGRPSMIMTSLAVKQQFSKYMFSSTSRIATPFQDHGRSPSKGLTVVGAVDVYVSDFGKLDIVPNYILRDDDVLVIDPEYWAVAYLTPMTVQEMAKVGDSNDKVIIADYTLISKNEAASGIVADIDETLAMTS